MLLNLERANDHMQRLGIDMLVASSPVNVAYLTGFDCFVYRSFKEYMMAAGETNRPLRSFAFLPRDGRPSLVTSISNISWARGLDVDLYPYGSSPLVFDEDEGALRNADQPALPDLHRMRLPKSAVEALLTGIQSADKSQMTVGLEFDTLDEGSIAGIRAALSGARVGNATEVMRLIRMVKTRMEIQKMEAAAEANESALRKCLRSLEPGTSWAAIRHSYLRALAKEAAYPEHYLYSVNGLDITDYDGGRIRRGDVGFIDIGCARDRYVADTGAAFCVGRLPRQASELYAKLRGQLDDAADGLAPGLGSLDLLKRMGEYAGKQSIKFIQHGHALGLEPREHPVIMDLPNKTIADDFVAVDSNIPLEENMVINIETPYYAFHTASYNLEKTFVITKSGGRSITRQDREAPFGA